ncbi:AAA family ATPase [Nonomuraea sp. NPDC023979]|uniref:AAA family ATPase n=1 Tax=Nonomuraea sp. NPDC023979 TaxID=3154796 RepID=UPI0033DEF774
MVTFRTAERRPSTGSDSNPLGSRDGPGSDGTDSGPAQGRQVLTQSRPGRRRRQRRQGPGSHRGEAGPVLYLALEDTARRLQNRMGKILGGQPAPKDLTLATTCPTLPQSGEEAIARWLDRHSNARLVVIDVFAKIRGNTRPACPRTTPTTPP